MLKQDYRYRIRRQAWFYLITVCCISVACIAIANLTSIRADWTENHIYTLSDSTQDVLDRLDEPLMIRAYITSGMPQPYARLQRFIADMLQSYHEAGHGRVGVEIIDPASDPNIAGALQALNVPKVQVQVVEHDRAQVKQGYLAIVLEYLDKKETIGVVQSETGFEYNLTRKIKKLTGKGRIKIGISTGFGAHSIQDLQQFKAWAQDDYQLVAVDLNQEKVADDIQALLVVGMLHAPSKAWRYHLDQFRMRGGGVWVLAGHARANLAQGFAVQATDGDAHDWLKQDLGVAVEPGLVMDKRAQRVTVRDGVFQSQIDYPFVVNVLDMDDAHIITRNLDAVSMPFASPLIATHPGAKVLLRSSPWSAVQNGPPFDVYPLMSMEKRFDGLQLQAHMLAYSRAGSMDSAFHQNIIKHHDTHLKHTNHGRLLVFGSPSFLDNEFMGGTGLVLTLNALDWLTHHETLIDLRSRSDAQHPLAALSDSGKSVFKAFWMLGLPVLVLLFGLWRWRVLRKRSGDLA